MSATANSPSHQLPFFKRLYLRVESWANSPHALWAMLAVSVVDGSVFPIPPFAILVPMVLANPPRWWRLATLGTVASLFGGVLGYGLGILVHQGMLSAFSVNLDAEIHAFGIRSTVGQLLGDKFWVLALLCSVLPTPFKVVSIGSGLVSVPFGKFMLAAVIGRTVRFFLIAGTMAFLGPSARKWLRA